MRHSLFNQKVVIIFLCPTFAVTGLKELDFNPRQAVILESDFGPPPVPGEGDSAESLAVITHQTPDTVEIKTRSAVEGYLVLLDTYYPGWVATVDGQPSPIYRADYLVRAVFVPAGEHQVRFEYRPCSFKLGLGLAGLMALVLVTAIIFKTQAATYLKRFNRKER